jgi:heptosyltransferase-3
MTDTIITNGMATFYRQLRHGTRVQLNFHRNRFRLEQLRRRLERETPRRPLVGVMLLENLGDIVACEPVARYLKREIPDACIVWGVKRAYRELIDTNSHVDLTLPVHCLTERLLLEDTKLFDRFIDLHLPDRYCSLCRNPLKRESTSSVRLNTYFSYGGLLSSFAQAAGLPSLADHPRVYVPHAALKRVDGLRLPDRFVAVNCSSNSAEKDWPAEKWLALAQAVVAGHNLPIVEVGLQSRLLNSLQFVNLCGRLSILETAEVIRRAALFIGIDSGPAHLANAVGTPGVILMGSHLGFTRYQPFSGAYQKGEKVEILQVEGPAAAISVEAALAAAHKLLNMNHRCT